MQWTGDRAHERYREVVAASAGALVGLDFDGTLAPIVEDPRQATIHPAMPDVLRRLCAETQTVAVITGRPARQAVALGGLDELADSCPNLMVLGQYGNETWTATDRRVISPPPPHGISGFLRELPAMLHRVGVDAWVEEKGIAVALHTRRLPNPHEAYRQLLPAATELAERHDLVIEPGRLVMEARAIGMHKGIALHRLAEATTPTAMIFAGDDLGDLPAFDELIAQRERGLPTLLVCSGSPEEPRIAEPADVILDGPDGVATFFAHFLDDASQVE